ncbi:phospholipase A and acyltransferase 3 [Anolis carolinensis]|uniref:LRAT domain-containing protein n=1 Tax=Anolis carolinensis TaxID=28377 RepID=A0A803TQH1_ANOCA|nr:PREDICTED: HRAS-like suppressor 3 [Anolis carolinensis]XP_016849447.1 PREDICTED: HRAS-like suppressor 3 [Anolis carolinensis]|eukprot:XP_008109686.1 PREDICTED: HRAS-like suppressor 3 [Anolis carolinensis]
MQKKNPETDYFQKFVDELEDLKNDVENVFRNKAIPKLGDMIQFQMPLFQHWGIYVGDGNVVQFGLPVVSFFPFEFEVRKEQIKDVPLAISSAVCNKFDKEYSPLPPERVVKRAEYMVGKVMKYNPGTANCEHFATLMRYNVARSGQAERFYLHVDPDFVKQIKRWLAEINE